MVTVEDFKSRVMAEGLEGTLDYYNSEDIEDTKLRSLVSRAQTILYSIEDHLDKETKAW